MIRLQEVSFLKSFILVLPAFIHCVGLRADFCVCTFCFHFQSILFVCKLFLLRLPDARSALTTFYIYILVTYFYNVCLFVLP